MSRCWPRTTSGQQNSRISTPGYVARWGTQRRSSIASFCWTISVVLEERSCGEVITASVEEDIGPVIVPRELLGKLSYEAATKRMTWQYRGPLDPQDVAALKTLSSAPAYRTALNEIERKAKLRDTTIGGVLAKISNTKSRRPDRW